MDIKKFSRLSGKLSIVFVTTTAFNAVFEYVLYPLAIYFLGGVWGTFTMTCFSLVANVLLVKIYDLSQLKVIEEIHEVAYRPARNFFEKIIKELMKNQFIMFVILSYQDPLYAVLYLRKGGLDGTGLTKKDWFILVLSAILGNIIWGGILTSGYEIIKKIFL